jgi:hypothetical protein
VAAALGTDALLGDSATGAAVSEGSAGARVIHLATHGVIDPRGPNRSALVLAGGDSLTVADFMGLDLAAELVVLSACHSGRGSAARNVVVSLWPVDDLAGCLLMAEFHRALPRYGIAGGLATAARTVREWARPEQLDRYPAPVRRGGRRACRGWLARPRTGAYRSGRRRAPAVPLGSLHSRGNLSPGRLHCSRTRESAKRQRVLR